jgi:hypothetical protein
MSAIIELKSDFDGSLIAASGYMLKNRCSKECPITGLTLMLDFVRLLGIISVR